ncbi:hypothetical protein MVEN_01219200 [Mycena venus]|uniref:Uncharacterized protein n=1 Tax=Mycena venus TaxID=2733690 RepID=A0A8H7CW52_9AGAR|nr:hypothetical protein MVEN_01219200 [Mycena venus]
MSLLSTIASVAGRLHRLELSLLEEDFQYLKRHHISLPNLRCLGMVAIWGTGPSQLQPSSVFPNTPLLRDLAIRERISIPDLNHYPNLTKLELPNVSLGTVLQILECRPLIIHLIAHLGRTTVHTQSKSPQTAEHLQSLVLSGSRGGEAALNSLTLPHLLHLELHVRQIGSDCFLSFLQRSACALDHLTLGFIFSRSFEACLKALPLLASLEVEVNHRTNVHLCDTLNVRGLLPCLRNLHVQADCKEFDYTLLPKALWKRRSHVDAAGRIEFVKLDVYRHSYDDDDDQDEDHHWPPPHAAAEFTPLLVDGLRCQLIWEYEKGWPEPWVDPCATFPY